MCIYTRHTSTFRFSRTELGHTFSMMASESPTWCRNPVSPSRMLSGIPPASAPITWSKHQSQNLTFKIKDFFKILVKHRVF